MGSLSKRRTTLSLSTTMTTIDTDDTLMSSKRNHDRIGAPDKLNTQEIDDIEKRSSRSIVHWDEHMQGRH